MRSFARVAICVLTLLGAAPLAAADTFGWRPPDGYVEGPGALSEITHARTFSRDQTGGSRLNFLYFDTPKSGIWLGPLSETARASSERTATRTCVSHEFLEWREIKLDGRDAVTWTWRCNAPVANNGSNLFGAVNFRRMLVVQGDVKIFYLQADAYFELAPALGANEALQFSDRLFETARWCSEDATCTPRSPAGGK